MSRGTLSKKVIGIILQWTWFMTKKEEKNIERWSFQNFGQTKWKVRNEREIKE